jgi:outer membrane lipoprotein-sorting protein
MMKRSHMVFAAGLLALVVVSGCNKKDAPVPASQAQPGAAMEQAVMAPSGKVVETMNSGGYTYVSLE